MVKVGKIDSTWQGDSKASFYTAILVNHGHYKFFFKESSDGLRTSIEKSKLDSDEIFVYEGINFLARARVCEYVRNLNLGKLKPSDIRLEDLLSKPNSEMH